MNNVEKTVVAIVITIFVLIGFAAVKFSIALAKFEDDCVKRGGVYLHAKNELMCLKRESMLEVK